MGGCHFQTASAKLNVHIAVFYHADDTIHKWYNHFLASQPLVLWVFGVNTHGGVSHNGLRTCGGHNGVVAFLVFVYDITLGFQLLFIVKWGLLCEIIFQVIQVTLLLFVHHLLC